ncbi:MAG TPA: hypothetical protein VGN46_06200 [Luteibacter sp.]|jgi:hypothetical protein|uniref:hypothetical protein n=1 Tax=Luteibacter sp. TaxID=1886636 RepID=UPI002F405952
MGHDDSQTKRPLFTRLRERLVSVGAAHVDLEAGMIVATPGVFRMREVPIALVSRVEAGNRDTSGWDNVFLFFHVDGEETLVLSEHDKGFAEVVNDLQANFPGIEGWESAVPSVKFQLTSVDLWRREQPAEQTDPV